MSEIYAKGGDPCPKTGYWHPTGLASFIPQSEVEKWFFKKDDLMPKPPYDCPQWFFKSEVL